MFIGLIINVRYLGLTAADRTIIALFRGFLSMIRRSLGTRPRFGQKRTFFGLFGPWTPPQRRFWERLLSHICYSPLGGLTAVARPWRILVRVIGRPFFGVLLKDFPSNPKNRLPSKIYVYPAPGPGARAPAEGGEGRGVGFLKRPFARPLAGPPLKRGVPPGTPHKWGVK